MIVVKVDLDNANGPEFDKHLFTMVIGNDGTGDMEYGNYDVYLGYSGCDDEFEVLTDPFKRGRVENHIRSSQPISLIQKAVESVV